MIGVPFSPPAPSPDPRPRRAPRVRRHLGRLLVAIGALTLPACDDPNALEVLRVVGALELGVRQAQIPDTMTAGVPSEITFWTSGGICVQGGDTEVDITGDLALVTPYDFLTNGGVCGLLPLRLFEHRANVVFDEPGTAEIVIVYSGNGTYLRQYGTRVYTVEVSQ